MPTIQRASGVRVTCPDTMAVSDEPAPRGRTRAFRAFAPPAASAPLADELVRSLDGLGLRLIDDVPLHTLEEPTDGIRRRRRGAPAIPPVQEVTFSTEVPAGERAVALIEQDGLYSWSYGEAKTVADVRGPDRRRRGAPSPPTSVEVAFTVPLYASSYPDRRMRLFGMERVFRPVRAFIFRFPSRFVVGQVVEHLERDVHTGLLRLTRPDVEAWTRLPDPSSLELPSNRPPRVLLFVHGTFSSTVGGFGALGVTDFGRAFMADALASYDAVLAFDHRTLSVDPLENAEELLGDLLRLGSAHPIVLDAVGHSRGGLVLRSLIEHLIPTAGWDASFGNVVFVGSTNGGTELADRENWHRLVDLYTNIAVGSMKGLSVVAPQTAAVTTVLAGLLRGLAALVKALATTVIDEEQVSGLAAMSPGRTFVTEINKTQPGQPTPATIDYYAVTSDFEPDEADEHTLPAKLLRVLADGVIDRLMGEANDLVVDVDSMTAIDPHVSGFVKDTFEFGKTGLVHHTNYFHHEATVKALSRWLDLADPTVTLTAGVPDRAGGLIEPTLPAYVDDDLVVVPATAAGHDVRDLLRTGDADWVVVRRHHEPSGEVFHYAYRPHEIDLLLDDDLDLGSSLDLHESTSSPEVPASLITGFDTRATVEGQPQIARTVAMREGIPVGVVPNVAEMRTAGPVPPAAPLPPPAPRLTRRIPVTPLGGARIRGMTTTRGVRGTSRDRRGSEPGSPELAEPQKVRHFFRAEMPQQVVLGEPESVEVSMSLEDLAVAAGRAGRAGAADIDRERNLLVDVRPRRSFEVVGEHRLEVSPLQPDDGEKAFFFDVRATDVGPGEIDVVIRQGQVPLVTLKLEPEVVARASERGRRMASARAGVTDAPGLRSPINELTIWEQRSRGETRLRFSFESPELNVRASAPSEAIEGGISDYVAGVYRSLEQRWLDRSHSIDTFTKDLRAIGMTMFEELIPPEIRRTLWEHRDDITNIQVLSEEPHIPWEIVHLRSPGGSARGGRFLGELGVVRWLENLPNNGFGPEHIDVDTALAIVPDYPAGSDWVLVEPAEEFAYLQRELGAVKVAANRADVDAVLETPGSFDLLHYAGHGEAPTEDSIDASLILGVTADGSRWVTERLDADTVLQFAELASGAKRPMVVLNACQVGRMRRRLGGTGGFARAFLTAGAGVFVSSLWSVGDEPARTFVESLYRELKEGRTISEATVTARTAAREAGDLTWLAYTVYAHPHATVAFG